MFGGVLGEEGSKYDFKIKEKLLQSGKVERGVK